MDIIKMLFSKENWILVIILAIAMFLYEIIKSQFAEYLDKLPFPEISVPIMLSILFGLTFGVLFKKYAIVVFAVVLAYGLIMENKSKIDSIHLKA